MQRVRRALVSVFDKTGVVDLAKALVDLGIEILSTGGTARLLRDNGLDVIDVADYTGFPEIMDGRVKTLHPKIHGALLGRRGEDEAVMRAHGIIPIDLVVVNLYPFERAVADPHCTIEQAMENVDIGGPAMLRAAAKNHASVCVVVDAGDYERLITELRGNGIATRPETRRDLATKAFEHTARYDAAIANYLGAINGAGERERFPRTLNLQFERRQTMRYGENPHQRAALYRDPIYAGRSIANAHLLQGKDLSFNNVADADAAWQCVKAFDEAAACVIVKHANPCGVALGRDPTEAYERAFRTDPTSAFGGIIAFNRALSERLAVGILERQFVEVVVVPEVEAGAGAALAAKPNVRVLVTGGCSRDESPLLELRQIEGGVLVQDQDLGRVGADELRFVTARRPTERELADLLFAWRVVKFVKSNAIVYCRDLATVGVGAGQMSRVYSARIAAIKAADEGLDVAGSVMASDAFFPFRDGIDSAAHAGVRAVIQPGGSVRDEEVIAAADEHGIAMVFTGMRHFRH